MDTERLLQSQRRAFRLLIIFDWASILLSLPLALFLGALFAPEDGGLCMPGLLFGMVAFAASIAWGILFYRRTSAPGLSANERLKRLGQAAITASYPAYAGVAVAILAGRPSLVVPFVGVAALNVSAIRRLGMRVLASGLDGQ